MAALPAKGCPLAYLAAFLQAVRKDFPWKDLAALKVPEHWFFSIFIFCSKSTRATWNSCSLCANWRFTSTQAPLGSCTKARGGSSLCKGQLAWGFLSEEATKDVLSLQHLSCVHLSRQGESHLHAALEHKALHTNALGHFWQAISSWSSPPPTSPLSYSTLCNWEIWHIYPIPQAVSMLFRCTLETKLLFLPTNHFQTNGGVCGSLDFILFYF